MIKAFFVSFLIPISAGYATINSKFGISEKVNGEIRVMIIDTGIGFHSRLLPYVQYDGSEDYSDSAGHGTHVAGTVAHGDGLNDSLCKNVKIFSCKYHDPMMNEESILLREVGCIRKAIKEKIDVINFSGGGPPPFRMEYSAFKDFTENGGLAIVAAGNEKSDIDKNPYYPASYSRKSGSFPIIERIIPIAAAKRNGEGYSEQSNWGKDMIKEVGEDVFSTLPNNSYGMMTGTSMAAPIFLHKLLKQKCSQMENL